jgi:FixJ family two-component response regulator
MGTVLEKGPRASPMSHPTTPVVFVVDDDASVRQPLELLIRSAGWEPQLFAFARDFLARPRALAASCLVLEGRSANAVVGKED